jgi:hypothetical protein
MPGARSNQDMAIEETLDAFAEDRRDPLHSDRRAAPLGGRRQADPPKPWWRRWPAWFGFVVSAWTLWRRVRR